MIASGRAISLFVMVLVAAPASAQVINGESTYGDSDLHQPPAETRPANAQTDKTRDAATMPAATATAKSGRMC